MRSGRIDERVVCPPEYGIPATYDWFNPITGSRDKLSYSNNFEPDNHGYNKNAFEQVILVDGFIEVRNGQSDLYFWLLNHPLNQTNEYYTQNASNRPPKPFVFKQVLPDRENMVFVNQEALVAKAVLMITDKGTKGYVNDEALTALAKAYGFGSTVNKGRKDLEAFMLKYAKNNPQKVIDDLTSSATEVRAILSDAVTYGVIKWDLPYVKFCDVSKGKRTVNNGIICQIPNGLDPMDYFVNYLREKDGSGVFNQLKKELEDKKIAEIELEEAK